MGGGGGGGYLGIRGLYKVYRDIYIYGLYKGIRFRFPSRGPSVSPFMGLFRVLVLWVFVGFLGFQVCWGFRAFRVF